MDFTYDDQPTAFVAVVRERVALDALAAFYDRAYRAVLEEVAAAGLAVTGPAFGWYRDMPTDSVDLAAGFWVDADSVSSLGGGVEVVELPGGPAVVGMHVGSYDGLSGALGRAPHVDVGPPGPDAWRLPRGVRHGPVGSSRSEPERDAPRAADRPVS